MIGLLVLWLTVVPMDDGSSAVIGHGEGLERTEGYARQIAITEAGGDATTQCAQRDGRRFYKPEWISYEVTCWASEDMVYCFASVSGYCTR